jgi:hypothetical protein
MPSTKINGGTVEIMMNNLLNAGLKKAIVHFDGCGDSGSIESVNYYKDHNVLVTDLSVLHSSALKDEKYPYESCSSAWDSVSNKWNETWTSEFANANKLIEIIAYEKLEESGIDWYNNDGGFGELTLFFNSKNVELDVNQRYTEVNSYTFKYNYLGKADDEGDE